MKEFSETLRVRVIRKLAERLNGVDVSKVHVGDSLDLSPRDARMLIAEGWAELVELPEEDLAGQPQLERESS